MAPQVKIAINAQDNASAALVAVQNKMKAIKADSGNASEGVKKLGKGFEELSKELLGAQGAAGNFAESLLEFSGGGLVTVGVVAGIALFVSAFLYMKIAQEDA